MYVPTALQLPAYRDFSAEQELSPQKLCVEFFSTSSGNGVLSSARYVSEAMDFLPHQLAADHDASKGLMSEAASELQTLNQLLCTGDALVSNNCQVSRDAWAVGLNNKEDLSEKDAGRHSKSQRQ